MAPPAAALGGELTLSASSIDVGDAGIRGYAQTSINTTDLRLSGGFDVDGELVITAGQIFPFTQTAATHLGLPVDHHPGQRRGTGVAVLPPAAR